MIETLKVPGATLHYEATGSGPVLLLIPGGPSDAGTFAGIRDLLAENHTVVTYDPRGLGRSTVDDPAEQVTVQMFADDAAAILAAVGSGPAFVLGHSSGGLVGLDLLARHPDQVRLLVTHEPPCTGLLSDAEQHKAFSRSVHNTYQTQGFGPAMAEFAAGAGLPEPPADPTPEMAAAMAAMQKNMEFFLGNMWTPMIDHLPPVEQLRGRPVVITVGEDSAAPQLPYRGAVELAGLLGLTPVTVPGEHGFDGKEDGFAAGVTAVLAKG